VFGRLWASVGLLFLPSKNEMMGILANNFDYRMNFRQRWIVLANVGVIDEVT
jgi:hypothetical protein